MPTELTEAYTAKSLALKYLQYTATAKRKLLERNPTTNTTEIDHQLKIAQQRYAAASKRYEEAMAKDGY